MPFGKAEAKTAHSKRPCQQTITTMETTTTTTTKFESPLDEKQRSFEVRLFEIPERLENGILTQIFPGLSEKRNKYKDHQERIGVERVRGSLITLWHGTNEDVVMLKTDTARMERDEVTQKMVELATELCSFLKKKGNEEQEQADVWADFADPETGLPVDDSIS
jgi:hypothetical protein